jgi:hypothetical protein
MNKNPQSVGRCFERDGSVFDGEFAVLKGHGFSRAINALKNEGL